MLSSSILFLSNHISEDISWDYYARSLDLLMCFVPVEIILHSPMPEGVCK